MTSSVSLFIEALSNLYIVVTYLCIKGWWALVNKVVQTVYYLADCTHIDIFATLRNNEVRLDSHLESLGISMPFTYDVIRLSKQLRDHLVLSELGKGKGCLHLCCKTIYSDYEKKSSGTILNTLRFRST